MYSISNRIKVGMVNLSYFDFHYAKLLIDPMGEEVTPNFSPLAGKSIRIISGFSVLDYGHFDKTDTV